jgi:hypothetical protein
MFQTPYPCFPCSTWRGDRTVKSWRGDIQDLTFNKVACARYVGESVNWSQIDIEQKHVMFEPGKNISRLILHQHWYTFLIALPVRPNPQHWSLLTIISATSASPFQPLRHQRNACHVSRPSCEPLYATNTFHCKQETFFMNILCFESFCLKNAQQNAALR